MQKSLEQQWEEIKHKGHDVPSPETRERLTKVETMQKVVMEEIKEIKDMIKELRSDVKSALDSKANKWTEKVLVSAGGFIGIGILSIAGWIFMEAIKRWN